MRGKQGICEMYIFYSYYSCFNYSYTTAVHWCIYRHCIYLPYSSIYFMKIYNENKPVRHHTYEKPVSLCTFLGYFPASQLCAFVMYILFTFLVGQQMVILQMGLLICACILYDLQKGKKIAKKEKQALNAHLKWGKEHQ